MSYTGLPACRYDMIKAIFKTSQRHAKWHLKHVFESIGMFVWLSDHAGKPCRFDQVKHTGQLALKTCSNESLKHVFKYTIETGTIFYTCTCTLPAYRYTGIPVYHSTSINWSLFKRKNMAYLLCIIDWKKCMHIKMIMSFCFFQSCLSTPSSTSSPSPPSPPPHLLHHLLHFHHHQKWFLFGKICILDHF